MTDTGIIKVFVTNLGKYNEGELIGEWVSLPTSEEELAAVLDRIGIGPQYEEYFITDSESELDGLEIGEYDSLDTLNEIAERLQEFDETDIEKIGAILEACERDIVQAIEKFDEYTYFSGYSMKNVAEELVDCGAFGYIPESIVCYIDYEAIARDLSCDGYVETENGVIRTY